MAGNDEIKVKIDNVVKKFETRNGEVVALNGVNLDIENNEFVCIVGPSGCGKSTLLNIIAGLQEPTSGQVLVDGKPVHGPGKDRGVVFQQYALFPWLTVRENVEFGLRLNKEKSDAEIKEISDKYLEMVELTSFANSYPKELSGGMKQRVQKDNGWRYEFKNVLLKDQRGIEYNYRIEEERVPGYKPIYSGYNIINEREMGAPVDPEGPEIPWEPYPPYDPTTPPVEPDKPILPVDPDKEIPPKDWTDSDVIEPEKPEPQTPEVPEPVKPDELEPIKPDDSVSEKPKESNGTVYTNKKEKSDPSKVNPKTLVEGYTTHIAAMVLAAITFVYADIKRRKNR